MHKNFGMSLPDICKKYSTQDYYIIRMLFNLLDLWLNEEEKDRFKFEVVINGAKHKDRRSIKFDFGYLEVICGDLK